VVLIDDAASQHALSPRTGSGHLRSPRRAQLAIPKASLSAIRDIVHGANLSALLAFSLSMPEFVSYLAFRPLCSSCRVTPGPDMVLVIGRGVGKFIAPPAARCWASWLPALSKCRYLATARLTAGLRPHALMRGGVPDLVGDQAAMGLPTREWHRSRNERMLICAARRVRGLINNLTNPKSLLFMVAFRSSSRRAVARTWWRLPLARLGAGLLAGPAF
jgi:hypothetical protein